MTFLDIEKSPYGSKPIECFAFTYRGTAWNFTSYDDYIELGGVQYEPKYIKRGKLVSEDDLFTTTVDIHMKPDEDIPKLFHGWLEAHVLLTIYRVHRGSSDVYTLWSGRLVSCAFTDKDAKLKGETLYSLIKKNGLNRVYQKNCPHVLYDTSRGNCMVDPSAYATDVTITSIDGTTLYVDPGGFAPDYFRGGYITVGGASRTVVSSNTNSVTLEFAYDTIQTGPATLYPGCDRTFATCRSKFNNELNYGGFTHIPGKNPFVVGMV